MPHAGLHVAKLGCKIKLIGNNILQLTLDKLLNNYAFVNRLPREQEIVSSLNFKPKILERKPIIERVGDKIKVFIDTFVEGMGGSV